MIKFLHLLSVIVVCTINLIECSNSIHDELRNYYDSSVQQKFKEEWKKYRHAFETEIASGLRENFGTRAVNIYEPEKHNAHLIARGFHLTDGVVLVFFNEMVLKELPALLQPKLNMELPSNFVNFESKLGRMFIDTTYYVARNSSSIIYAHPEDQRALSPFSLQQVDTIGKVVVKGSSSVPLVDVQLEDYKSKHKIRPISIIVEDCLLSGISVATLSGDSVSLGHSPFLLTDCKFMVEISTPNSGAPPVIAPYFPPGPRETLEMIIARPIREELQTKLQGAMYSYINTSVLFGNKAADFRNNQQKLFKSYAEFMTDYVSKMNQNTIKANKANVDLPGYEVTMNTETDKRKQQCHVGLEEIILYGLDTAYATRAGGPYNGGSVQTAADTVIFSSMQIRGKITHDDKNGSSMKNFAADLTDVTVVIAIVINEDKTELQQIHFTGWRSLEFSIIPRETSAIDKHDHQSLVYGHILNKLPVRVLNHVTSLLGHKPIDKNGGTSGGNNGGGGNGSGDDNGGSNGSGGGGSGGGDDNGGSNGGGEGGNGGGDDIGGSNGGDNGEGGANEDKNGGEDANKMKNKTEGFFSDDILDDNFPSDDEFIDKNFFNDSKEVLDKNFLKDSQEILDKNFFNDSKENTGSDNKDNMNIDDGGRLSSTIDKNGVEGDNSNIPGGGDLDKADAPDETNRGVEDEGNNVIENIDTDPGFENVDKSGANDEEQENLNFEKDSFSDDFIEKDFFSDMSGFGGDFGSKEQSDVIGKVEGNNGNYKDQIGSADDSYSVPGIGEGQVGEDEENSEGEKEEVIGNNGKENPIDSIENGNELLEDKADGGGQVNVHEGSIGSFEEEKSTGAAANSYFSDDKKSFFSDDNKPFFSDDKKPFLSDDNQPFFSDDNKPFFSDDVMEKDFISDNDFGENFGGKEQGDDTGKAEGDNRNKDQIESDDAGYNMPVVSDGNGEVGEAEKNVKGEIEEAVIGNNGKENPVDNVENTNEVPDVQTGGGEQVHEGSHDSFQEEKSTGGAVNSYFSDDKNSFLSDDNKPFFSNDALDKDFFSDENQGENSNLKTQSGGNKQNQGDLNLDKEFFSDENIKGEKTKLNGGSKKHEGGKGVDGDNGNDKHNVDIGKKKLWLFASQGGMKSEGEFLDTKLNFDMERRAGSRRQVSQSKENVTESVEDLREGKKFLPSNVHNARRHQNMHTSENEIR